MTVLPVAVNGPMVVGGEGRSKVRPVGGTGLGMGALKARSPDAIEAGVAPVASTATAAVPVMDGFPRAAAAETIDDGSVSEVWKFAALNCWPAERSAGIVALVVTLLRTMLPTGVPGQYSSKAPVVEPGGGGTTGGIVVFAAITGEMGDVGGGADVMPLIGSESLGYEVHVKVKGMAVSLPEANSVSPI